MDYYTVELHIEENWACDDHWDAMKILVANIDEAIQKVKDTIAEEKEYSFYHVDLIKVFLEGTSKPIKAIEPFEED